MINNNILQVFDLAFRIHLYVLFYWKYLLASLTAGEDITSVVTRRYMMCSIVHFFVGLQIYWLQNVAYVQLQNT